MGVRVSCFAASAKNRSPHLTPEAPDLLGVDCRRHKAFVAFGDEPRVQQHMVKAGEFVHTFLGGVVVLDAASKERAIKFFVQK